MKKLLANTLSYLGSPFSLSAAVAMTSVMDEDTAKHLVWSLPLAIVTLPLAPFAYLGSKLYHQITDQEFLERTKDAPVISLTKLYEFDYTPGVIADIDVTGDSGMYYFYSEKYYSANQPAESFHSLEGLYAWLKANGFIEVRIENEMISYWICKEDLKRHGVI